MTEHVPESEHPELDKLQTVRESSHAETVEVPGMYS